ncbi:hypothetical protein G6011_04772 [Alternaria panax]|uniref:Uncharacterized protein n=1 Tax=Alternaria panax TaxID=48097 RepID=A0AAD4NU77_9PLEO|nr:hypothetical protein G6011_04772 [Alternaria panax]
MDYASDKSTVTIDESVTNWYAQTVSSNALSKIPDHFNKIPTFESLHFRHRESFDPIVITNWPQEASLTVLVTGMYDDVSSDTKPLVYAFVHGSKNHFVGHFLIKPDFSIRRISHHDMDNVEFEEPFCDLGDRTVGTKTVRNRIRAVVLFYFLAAGHVRDFGKYRDFWRDFTKSCAWIANEGSLPKVQRQDARPAARSPVVLALGATTPKKRAGNEELEMAPARIKRRDYSHAIRQSPIIISRSSSSEQAMIVTSVDARLRTSEVANDLLRAEIATQIRSLELYQARVTADHQLESKVADLVAEVSRVKNEAMYSQNAYRGIQAQYDDLRVQHINALNDTKGLHERLRQDRSRLIQADKRSKVLETEVERLKRKMNEAREALDDSSL